MNVSEKEKKIVFLFFVKANTKEREESESMADLGLSNEGSFYKQNSYKKSKNMNSNWMGVKSSWLK